jgi:hypothetical protein
MTSLPQWVISARGAPSRRQSPDAIKPVAVGQIRRALPMDPGSPPALILVIGTDVAPSTVTVALLSPDIELATDRDMMLDQADTGLPYALLAQSDVFGYIWAVQLDAWLADAPTAVVDAIAQSASGGASGHITPAGSPVLSGEDPRWRFKEAELARLTALSTECTEQLLEGEIHTHVDPFALRPPEPDDLLDVWEFVLNLADGLKSGSVELPAWLLADKFSEPAYERKWRESGAYDAYRVLTGLLEQLLPCIDNDPPLRHGNARVEGRVGAPAGSDPVAPVLVMEAAHGHRCVRLLARSGDWDRQPARALLSDDALMQIVPVLGRP